MRDRLTTARESNLTGYVLDVSQRERIPWNVTYICYSCGSFAQRQRFVCPGFCAILNIACEPLCGTMD
jgi:hypothetical protein